MKLRIGLLVLLALWAITAVRAEDSIPDAKAARYLLKTSTKSLHFGSVTRAGEMSVTLSSIDAPLGIGVTLTPVSPPFSFVGDRRTFALMNGQQLVVTVRFAPIIPANTVRLLRLSAVRKSIR